MTIRNHTLTNYAEKSPSPLRKWISSQWKGIIAEFTATMFLILFGCMSCIPIEGLPMNPVMYAPLTFGMIVMLNIQVFGHLSGAYMNPFVTVTAVIWGRISIIVGIIYIIMELAGASIGYGILIGVAPVDMGGEGICLTLPHPGINEWQALGVEIVLSAALSLVNCSVWDPVNETKLDSVPLKFALTIAGLSFAGGPLTGASMNPARSFGPALWSNRWDIHWVYWVGPFVGGIIPAVFYKYIWSQKPESKLP
nr:aquaporin [Agriphila aeneociliella]